MSLPATEAARFHGERPARKFAAHVDGRRWGKLMPPRVRPVPNKGAGQGCYFMRRLGVRIRLVGRLFGFRLL